MPGDWSLEENEAIVADYFAMLAKEAAGVAYNKSEHRRELSPLLAGRTDGSIELKHQNISAILEELGLKRIVGYKPRFNYQFSLLEAVIARGAPSDGPSSLLSQSATTQVEIPAVEDILAILDIPPSGRSRSRIVREKPKHPYALPASPRDSRTIDYLQQEAARRSLGAAGEELVLRFEHARLMQAGAQRLADQVRHVSRDVGDGEGFDIYSFERSGRPRLIEVKTTNHSKDTPFYLSRNEVLVSQANEESYHLYRLHSFQRAPRMFTLAGALTATCVLDPVHYLAVAS